MHLGKNRNPSHMRIASELEITVTDRRPWQQQTQGSDDANQTGRRMKIQLELRD